MNFKNNFKIGRKIFLFNKKIHSKEKKGIDENIIFRIQEYIQNVGTLSIFENHKNQFPIFDRMLEMIFEHKGRPVQRICLLLFAIEHYVFS